MSIIVTCFLKDTRMFCRLLQLMWAWPFVGERSIINFMYIFGPESMFNFDLQFMDTDLQDLLREDKAVNEVLYSWDEW